jgi:hypothetical protein
MPAGLEVFNASGVQVFFTDDRLTRYTGQFVPATVNGSFTVPEWVSLGTALPWWIPLRTGATANNQTYCNPNFQRSGSSITWTSLGVADNDARHFTVLYGVY